MAGRPFNAVKDKRTKRPASLPASARIALYRQLADYARNGDTLVGAIGALAVTYRRRREGKVLQMWRDGLKGGETFGVLVSSTLPVVEGGIITAALEAAEGIRDEREAASRRAAGFDEAANLVEMLLSGQRAIMGVLAMPALLLFEVALSLWNIDTQIGPVLANIQRVMHGFEMPAITWPVIHAKDILAIVLPIGGSVIGIYAIFVITMLESYTGSGRRWLNKLPFFAFYRVWGIASAFLNFAILNAEGRTVHLEAALRHPVAARLLPSEQLRRIRSAADAGRMADVLPQISKSYIIITASRARRTAQTMAYVLMVATAANGIWQGYGLAALIGTIMTHSL
jgi:type II secretory pathway component PulF